MPDVDSAGQRRDQLNRRILEVLTSLNDKLGQVERSKTLPLLKPLIVSPQLDSPGSATKAARPPERSSREEFPSINDRMGGASSPKQPVIDDLDVQSGLLGLIHFLREGLDEVRQQRPSVPTVDVTPIVAQPFQPPQRDTASKAETKLISRLAEAIDRLAASIDIPEVSPSPLMPSKVPAIPPKTESAINYPQRSKGSGWETVQPEVRGPSLIVIPQDRSNQATKSPGTRSSQQPVDFDDDSNAGRTEARGVLGGLGKILRNWGFGVWGDGEAESQKTLDTNRARAGSRKAKAGKAEQGMGSWAGGATAVGGMFRAIDSHSQGEVIEGTGAAVGGALSMIPHPAAKVAGAAVIEFSRIIGKATDKLKEWSDRIVETNTQMAEFSGDMADVHAKSEVRRIKLLQERGERRAEWAGKLMESRDRYERAASPFNDWWDKQKSTIATWWNNFRAEILEALNRKEKAKEETGYEFLGKDNWLRQGAEEMERERRAMEEDRPAHMR